MTCPSPVKRKLRAGKQQGSRQAASARDQPAAAPRPALQAIDASQYLLVRRQACDVAQTTVRHAVADHVGLRPTQISAQVPPSGGKKNCSDWPHDPTMVSVRIQLLGRRSRRGARRRSSSLERRSCLQSDDAAARRGKHALALDLDRQRGLGRQLEQLAPVREVRDVAQVRQLDVHLDAATGGRRLTAAHAELEEVHARDVREGAAAAAVDGRHDQVDPGFGCLARAREREQTAATSTPSDPRAVHHGPNLTEMSSERVPK